MRTARLVADALGGAYRVYDVRRPFCREPNFGVISANYDLTELLVRAERPA
jgi:hypothetical protein